MAVAIPHRYVADAWYHSPMLYDDKESRYFGLARRELIELIPPGDHRVLEIGAGDGATGAALKASGRASYVAGVELNETAAQTAKTRLDEVIGADVEKTALPYPAGHFQYIVCGDVLEHLVDPWETVKKLSALLAPGGAIVASIPNIRHRRIIKNLVLKGRWQYQQEGILDITHLRFFTRASALELFSRAGLQASVAGTTMEKKEDRWIAAASLGLLTDFVVLQYLITARKPS